MYFFFLTESSILVLKGVNSMVDQHSIVLKKIIKNKNQKRMAKKKRKKEVSVEFYTYQKKKSLL